MSNQAPSPETRPIIVDGQEFQSYSDVSDYLLHRLSEGHTVSRRFGANVLGDLILRDGVERLKLVGERRFGEIVRHKSGRVEEGVTVSTATRRGISIVAHVEPWESKLLDRGLAWVYVDAGEVPAPARFSVHVNREHDVGDVEEMAQRLQTAEIRADALIEGILAGDANPPFAQSHLVED